jgi:hypothetical protein
MQWYKAILILACFGLVGSCGTKTESKKTTIASYKKNKLYLEDISSQFKPFLSKDDSVQNVQAMANSWLQQQVLLDFASQNLGDSIAQFDRLIEDYKKSLLIYHYENTLSKQSMDTAITDSTLLAYYEQNKQNFELKRNIVKIWYAKFNINFGTIAQVVPYFKGESKESLAYVKEFCEQYAENHFVSSTDWLYFDEIRKEIPLDPSYDQSAFIANNKFRQFKDEEYVYLLKIVDYKVKNSLSPFDLVKNEIKHMILNERRVALLKENQKKLLKKAKENGDAKIL